MATFVMTSCTVLGGTSWTGTGPGTGNPTVSGTVASSTDWSDHVKSVRLDLSSAGVDFTNFGSGGYTEQKPGLLSHSLTIDFFNDFAASNVDSFIQTAYFGKSLVYLDIKPTSSARSATNPSYVVACYVATYPLGATVGGASEASVGFMQAGKFARLTS